MTAEVNNQTSVHEVYTRTSVDSSASNDHLLASSGYQAPKPGYLDSDIQPPPPTPTGINEYSGDPNSNTAQPSVDTAFSGAATPAPGAWRASPFLNGADSALATQSTTAGSKATADAAGDGQSANQPWKGAPYQIGADLPLANPAPAQTGDPNAVQQQWHPKPGPSWSSPGPAPVSDGLGGTGTTPQGNSLISSSLQANIQQSLVPHYGFDGLSGQLGYLSMGGVGGAIGKTVLSSVLNRNAWWLANTSGDLSLGLAPKPDFGPTETSGKLGDLRSGFIEGAAFAALSSGILDNSLDRFFNQKDHKDSWFLSGLAVPMAFSSSADLKTKIMLGVGSIVVSKGLDSLLPASDHKAISQIFAPTGIEAVSMGAAWALPAPADLKLPIVGGTWLFNRMINLDAGDSLAVSGVIAAGGLLLKGLKVAESLPVLPFLALDGAIWLGSRLLHKDQPDDQAINEAANRLVSEDKSTRSAKSMTDAIDKYVQLGNDKEFVLRAYYEEYLTKTNSQFDDMLTAYRGAMILGTSFGESRLSHGTTILPAEKPTYILADQNLDLGGQALRGLIIANVNAERAKLETLKLVGQSNHGSKVDKSEVDGITQIQARTNADIAKIYGKHDLTKALSDLTDFQKSNQMGFAKLEIDLVSGLSSNRQSEPQFQAKLFRDYALLCLTYASVSAEKSSDNAAAVLYGSDSGRQIPYPDGAPRGFDGALDAIKLAAQLAPDNPDNQQLQAIAADLEKRIPAAQQVQDANPLYNPLAITDSSNTFKYS
ncbi:hypothetical protein BH10CYA1_BH10CYA1_17890 [soil metagenome]